MRSNEQTGCPRDYLGRPLGSGVRVCIGWKAAATPKRRGVVSWIGASNDYVVVAFADGERAVSPRDCLVCF